MTELRTIILAAGKGTRMKSERPKVLHLVCGLPILGYVLNIARAVRSLKTYVVCGHQHEEVAAFLGSEYTVVRQLRQLGTADAVRCVQKSVGDFQGDFLILCGDTPLLSAQIVKDLVQKHRRAKSSCTFLTAVVSDPSGYGRVLRDEAGSVGAIREHKNLTTAQKSIQEINVGVYCVRASALWGALKRIKLNPVKKEFYLTDMIELMVKDGLKVETLMTPEAWQGMGINSRIDLAFAEQRIRKSILERLMLDGVTVVDPATTYINASVKIGQDTIIQPCTVIDENVRVGKHCVIGPFAHLRPGSRVGDHVEIGNFTEVSRSSLGENCFMKHFSFLGDAQIGHHTNIGAGTVTANFDGVNKNRTRIGNHAFIGSDAVLVAPVQVGHGAVIGAGSVVTKGQHIPDQAIAFGVPARIKARRATS